MNYYADIHAIVTFTNDKRCQQGKIKIININKWNIQVNWKRVCP